MPIKGRLEAKRCLRHIFVARYGLISPRTRVGNLVIYRAVVEREERNTCNLVTQRGRATRYNFSPPAPFGTATGRLFKV